MHPRERLEKAGEPGRVLRPPRDTSPGAASHAHAHDGASAPSGAAHMIRLQREAGNQAVGRALHGSGQVMSIQRMPQGPPAPPLPPPPPILGTRPPAPTAAAAASDTEFELPAEHAGIRSTVPNGRLPLRNKPLVRQVLTKYYGVNRTDIIEQIKVRYAQVNGEEFVETPDMAALREGQRPGYKDSDAYIANNGGGGAPPHWPVVPGGAVKVHKGSLEGWHLAPPGSAFTGLVRFGGQDNGAPTEPKIILFPTQSTGEYLKQGVAEHPKEDAAEPPEILKQSRVYQNRYSEYTTHAASGALSSHGKLSSRIQDKPKYANLVEDMEADDLQGAGMTIGFTVIKGAGPAAHKYSFVSRSSNNHTFDLVSHEEKSSLSPMKLMRLKAERSQAFGHLVLKANGEGSITKEWGEKIISSVNSAVG
ncbi:hypothetical protein [Streptomyces sp. CRN 30]|uniref:hypothetical protein n=1 Tax=Streptomyces sp. CRN 30 TaxID=3075613 RepID=UPI002A7F5842|nr:hypothetical protein [Streptomyces sp. CRN 30]